MTVRPDSHDDHIKVVWTKCVFANETVVEDGANVVVDDDDVEAHGMLGVVAAAAIMAGSAGGAWVAGAGTALAPEPAKLTANLSDTTGSTGAAYYLNSNAPTTVVRWGKDFVGGPNLPPAGQPCSTTALTADSQTTKVIQAAGSQRRCY